MPTSAYPTLKQETFMNANPFKYTLIPDWSRLRQRYQAFWNKKVLDDSPIVHIQNPNPNRPEPKDWMLEASSDKYLNPVKYFELSWWRRTSWNWYADLFKYLLPSYGPNVFVGFCGGRPEFGRDTVWHEPVITDLDESEKIHFDEDNCCWKIHLETVKYFSEYLAGVAHLGITDLGGPADWISTLMGTENFLIATAEQPDKMREFALRLASECNRAYDLLYPLITADNDGIVNWMPVWSDRRLGTVQDDIAINFSPEMYRDIFLPALQTMAAHTEHTVLHWHDGCAQHIDTLLAVKEIDLFHLGHDPNSPPFRKLLPDMKKIQAAGKNLFISCVEADDVEYFLSNLDPRGLMMIINTKTDKDSQRMEDDVNVWTRRRMRQLVP
jgi:hypothetical protein